MPSRPTCSPLRWADLTGSAVGVWGIGTEGRASLARLSAMGIAPAAIVDDVPEDPRVLATAEGGLEALARCDIVVKTPGISRYSDEVGELERAGLAVVGGLGLWLETVGSDRVVGITGTKGKSTTTSVAGHLARRLGVDAFVGGNLGIPPWDPTAPESPRLWLIEVSSYQATDLWSSPAVAAATSLHPDHLNWHDTVEHYYDDKLSLFGKPGGRVVVANGTDERLRERTNRLVPGPIWVDEINPQPAWVAELRLRGRHNQINALIAARCLTEVGVAEADDPHRLKEVAVGYEPLPSRLTTVAVIDGVEYVDDSLSTNVLPTIAAVDVFADQPLALIVGGFDRNIDYIPLALHLARRTERTIAFTVPQNGQRIASAIASVGGACENCDSIAEAVGRAAEWSTPGSVVLLSPAAASYGLFRNYTARAQVFRQAVALLAGSNE